ncbi:hypothetical protein [Mailhella massiliensis]|uniref:hypothetical protein n=1 Tax=Mailhella massiliensis TaxID=1903261 RepID=UPI0023F3E737|nr:hypothetical protein [Mailhella massiliensis]
MEKSKLFEGFNQACSYDERGREVLSDVPVAFNVPVQKNISTLDFHRQRILEERERLREMLARMKEDSEFETFEEANDFNVEDPLDPEAFVSSFELDDDIVDPVRALAEAEHRRVSAVAAAKAPQSEENGVNPNGNPS